MFVIYKMKSFKIYIIFAIIFLNIVNVIIAKTNSPSSSSLSSSVVIDSISDIKELKKLLRTKTNVLILFVSNLKDAHQTIKIFNDASEIIKGLGTMVLLDCSNSDKKKLCKKLKVSPSPYTLKHYKDGDYHKDYDRQITVTSIVNFMRDPTGDLPWEEDPTGADVIHIQDSNILSKFLKKETKPIMIMFYAPWCGFCKQLKPEYSLAATELKSKYILAAINVDRPENAIVRRHYNITGFPTLLYFENGKLKYTYDGENKKSSIIQFMENPTESSVIKKPKDDDWSADTTSDIVHLTTNGFEPALKDEKSVLVMFYAPWCGHCKRMKPEYEKAAEIMKNEKIPGVLAALDATKETTIAQKYGVKGYPTVKYFVNGEYKFDVNVREADKIVNFMKDPKEPPPPPPPEKPWEEEESEIVHLNQENFKPILKKKKHALVMFYAPWCGHCKKAKPEFTSAANHFKDDPRITVAAIDCTRYQSVCSVYEVRGYPTFKYFSYLKTKIDYNGGRTEKDFINFLNNPESLLSQSPSQSNTNDDDAAAAADHSNNNNVKNNNQKVPADNNVSLFGNFPGSDKILLLNDNNFDTELKLNKKLFVMFYTSWCNHCKIMKPEFALAATKLTDNENKLIKFAALDCDQNHRSVDKYKIDGFPTVILFDNGKLLKIYEGPRKSDNLLKFVRINNNAKDEL